VTTSQLGRVVFWMTGTLLSFSAMALSVRALAGKFSVFEILTLRSGLGLVILLIVGLTHPPLWRTFVPRRLHWHFLRNGTHLFGQYLWTLGLTLLPLATVFALEFTMPAWVALLAALFLGERLTTSRVGAVACGFVGVLLILRPGFTAFQPAALLVLAAAFSYATSNIGTKKLLAAGDSTFAILLWMSVIQLPIAFLGSDPLFFTKIAANNVLGVIGIGVCGLSAHYCLTNALAAGDATAVIPLDFMRLPLIAFIGWTFYGEAMDVLVSVGGAVIIAGVLWNLNSETRRTRLLSPGAKPAPPGTVDDAHA
jgi:drug/metabolite transporter (DMT)-like permease